MLSCTKILVVTDLIVTDLYATLTQDIAVLKIHSQIFLQFIKEISQVSQKEQEPTLNHELGILMNTMMTDLGFLKQYTKVNQKLNFTIIYQLLLGNLTV